MRVRMTMVSGNTMIFENLQTNMETLGQQCAENTNMLVLGENGKTVVVVGRHVESIEEL